MRHFRLPVVICHVSVVFSLALLLLPARAQGLTTPIEVPGGIDTKIDLRAPEPRVIIPGVFFDVDDLKLTEDGYLYVPFLGQYIAAVYRYAVTAASVIAVIVIIFSGFQWTISAGSQDVIGAAKKRIVNAVIGLVLAIGSYTILYAINPELVQFRALRLQVVKPIALEDIEGFPETQPDQQIKINDSITCKEEDLKKTFSELYSSQALLGKSPGYCLSWVKAALNKACGGIKSSLNKTGAWDVAAALKDTIMQHPCSLDGIKTGDLVFMTTLGSNYIGLWENWKVENGCTRANAVTNKNIEVKGKEQPPVQGAPEGMPPVTHIGVYVDGKIYHLTKRIHADDVQLATTKTASKVEKDNWEDVPPLQGKFIGSEFIAGYASW